MPELASSEQALLDLLIEGEFISEGEAKQIKKYANKEKIRVSQAVSDLSIMSDEHIGIIVADFEGIPFIKVSSLGIPDEILDLIPPNIAKDHMIVPFKKEENILFVATDNIKQKELLHFLEKKTRMKIKLVYAARSDIKDALRAYEIPLKTKLKKAQKEIETKGEKKGSEAIANLLDDIIFYSAIEHASDIHFEPQKNDLLIRARIDGMLKEILTVPKEYQETITTRIKVLANLRTDEHRSAQDGRIKMEFPDLTITLRVSIIPIYDGEKIVLRILANQSSLKLESLGYSAEHLGLINKGMKKSHGMILVTGPTGCGKTTTLYSVLRILNKPDVNLSTIEDPVEIRLPGTNQIQVNNEANLSFANGLRSILRQDPDIVLVGEIRDGETANIAVNAALTGHLVLATLHTNDAASSLPRLLEMGVEHFLVASTVNIVIAQRLVRKICPYCIQSVEKPLEELVEFFSAFETFDKDIMMERQYGVKKKTKKKKDDESNEEKEKKKTNKLPKTVRIFEGSGCENCNKTGYKGRVAIAEFIEIDQEIRELIKKKALANEIVKEARKKGMITMMEDGFEKVLNGMTTVEEVLRVTRE